MKYKYNLSEIQNYLEYLYSNIGEETERVEISVDLFEELREIFNSFILLSLEYTQIQKNLSVLLLGSMIVNFLLVFIFIFKI